jgi:attachment p12 family protein
MNWQLAIVIVLVAAAGLYLARQTWRTWAGKKAGCGSGCGCASQPNTKPHESLISSEQLVRRLKQAK